MTERPDGVPAEAVWDPGDEEWVFVPTPDDQASKHGLVTYWRADGSLVCRSEYRHGVAHGPMTRYHQSGEVSWSATFVDGELDGIDTAYRSAAATTETSFHPGLPEAIVRCEVERVRGVLLTVRWYDRDGNDLTMLGEPMPDRPPTVHSLALFSAEGDWYLGPQDSAEKRVGLTRWWDRDGTPVRVEYHHQGECVAIADRRSGEENSGKHPLIAAALAGDDAAVEACLAAGLWTMPGTALQAAYAGLPALAARLAGYGQGTAPEDEVPQWPQAPEPERPSNAAPEAVWVAGQGGRGGWLLGDLDPDTGTAVGRWRFWGVDSFGDREVSWEETEFAAGRPTVRREYYGFRFSNPDRLAERVHADGYPLRVECHLDQHGQVRLRRRFDDDAGLLHKETETLADGTIAERAFYKDSRLRTERITRDGTLIVESWFAPDGSRTAEVLPSAERWLDEDGDEVPVKLWRGLDGGRVIAEGLASQKRGRPVGDWRLLDADGVPYATVDFTPLTGSSLGLAARPDLGQIAVALHAWKQAPWPAALADVHDVGWAGLETYFGSGEPFPFLLKGLAQPDPLIFDVSIGQIEDPILHQQTIEEITGPAVRYMVALAPELASDPHRKRLLGLIAHVATREGSLAATAQIKAIYRSLPAATADPAGYFIDRGVEGAYHEVYAQISSAIGVWTALAASPHPIVRHSSLILLAAAVPEEAAATLRGLIGTEPERAARADAALGLLLHGDTEPSRDVLAGLMADRAAEPLIAFCAALSWLRMRATPAAPALDVITGAVRGDLDTTGFDELYFGSGEAVSDAATTLALLPSGEAREYLPRLCAVLEEVNALNVIGVANALLHIAFAEGYDAEPLTASQRQVIAAIEASDNAWTFNANLFEVLRNHGLPTDREKLRSLIADTPGN